MLIAFTGEHRKLGIEVVADLAQFIDGMEQPVALWSELSKIRELRFMLFLQFL